MELVADISSLRARIRHKSSIAFVPTMGSLHEGHLSLVRLAQQEADCVVVSIFVNRLQFAPGEDFERYPRALADDCELLENHGGANMIFAPGEKDLYPVPQQFMLEPPPVADILEGEFRPGFFRGVATVVLKLLNIVQPQTAIFGKKDYQQLHIMRELVRQLNFPVKIVAGETVRAPDNLASSSRNRYLTNEERAESARLYQVLLQVKQEVENGNENFHGLEENAKRLLREHHWKIDYISVRHRDTLAPPCKEDENLVILGAARLGKTRLIDNLEISVKN
ncbi:MAG: pantoate--beta-alanine ligase [Nitrosospira sp.]